MSLYNNVSANLKSTVGSSVSGTVSGFAGSALGRVLPSGKMGSLIGGVATNLAQKAAIKTANGLVNKYVPKKVQGAINTGLGTFNDIQNGNTSGAIDKIIDSGLINFGSSGKPIALYGGISVKKAKKIYQQLQGQQLSKKNLFLIEVESNLDGSSISETFNMFVIGVDYTPFTITGEKRKVGGAVVDVVTGGEATDLSFTTYDDKEGSLKRWFAMHQEATVSRDGTVGVPSSYAIKIKVHHGGIEAGLAGYVDIGYYRANTLETSLSRSEDAIEQLTMTFSQLDTFLRV